MKKAHIWALVGIVALGAFLRFYAINEIPLGLYPDEAINGNNALEALATGDFRVFYPENNGREGLFINLQALSLAIFGNTPWALRIISAIFGTLTIFGVYLITKELFVFQTKSGNSRLSLEYNFVGLLAAFFTATSYWHLNFSRIGFRAIMVPFFAVFAVYFLLKGLRRGSIADLAFAGVFTGLGLHTYIAFRFMAPVIAVPLATHLWQSRKKSPASNFQPPASSCAPCAAALFISAMFIIALPLGLYFIESPDAFINRAEEISVFAAVSPLKEFAKSATLTLGMLFWNGDCNWRHNFNCQPALHPIVALLVLVGISQLWRLSLHSWEKWLIAVWTASLALPAALTRESVPHALRAIGMIPPLMILAGLGADRARLEISRWTARRQKQYPQYTRQLSRIRYEMLAFFALALLTIPFTTYRAYFLSWSNHPKTYEAFDTSSYHLGQFLTRLPPDIRKYVVVNARGVDVRGIPMPSQTVMFITDSFTPEKQAKKNIRYIAAEPGAALADMTSAPPEGNTVIAFIDGGDARGIAAAHRALPDFKIQAPGDFVILQNF